MRRPAPVARWARLAGWALAVLPVAGCLSMPTDQVTGQPLAFPTSGAPVSNACGLLPLDQVYRALGGEMAPPAVGSDGQPPNCTWYSTEAGQALLTLEVTTDPVEVAAAQVTVSGSPPAGSRPVGGLGLAAQVDQTAGGVTVLLTGGRVLFLRLTSPQLGPEVAAAVAVSLARQAVRSLGARRPVAATGQLLVG